MVNWHEEYLNITSPYFETSQKYMQQNSLVKVYEIDSFYVFVYEQISFVSLIVLENKYLKIQQVVF